MLKQVHLNDNVIYQYHKKYTVPIACFTKRLDLRKYVFSNRVIDPVSYTHLTLPTNREV